MAPPTPLTLRFAGGSGSQAARLFVGGQRELRDDAFLHGARIGLIVEAAGGNHDFVHPKRADGAPFLSQAHSDSKHVYLYE